MSRTQMHVDDAVASTHDGVRASQRAINRSLDRMVHSAQELRDEARPAVDRLAGRASEAARHGMDWVRDSSDRVRTRVVRASDRTVGYVRDEPVRAALMAVAAGALLYAAVRLISSQRDEH